MHELGVVFHIIDDLKAVASDNDVSSISKVTIELGEVSGVVEEYLTDLSLIHISEPTRPY